MPVAMVGLAVAVGDRHARRGLRRGRAAAAPADRAPPARRARPLAVCLPLASVLLSGWVMFHMGDDVKILAVVGCLRDGGGRRRARPRALDRRVGRPRARRVGEARRRRPHRAGARRPGRARSRTSRPRSTRWPRASSSSSTPAASSSPGRATTCARRSRTCRRCSRRSRTASPSPSDYLPALREQVRVLSLARRRPVRARPHRRRRADARAADGAVWSRSSSRACAARAGGPAARHRTGRRRVPGEVDGRCAPEKIERVLFNLLTNALRHTPSDGSVAVRVEQPDTRGARDASRTPARGSEPEARARMFERFWRADPRALGAGIGPRPRDRPRPRRGPRRPDLGREPPRGRGARLLHAARRDVGRLGYGRLG